MIGASVYTHIRINPQGLSEQIHHGQLLAFCYICLSFKKIINLYYANICTYFILVECFVLIARCSRVRAFCAVSSIRREDYARYNSRNTYCIGCT